MNKKSVKTSTILKIIFASLSLVLLTTIVVLLSKPELLYQIQGKWLRPDQEYSTFKMIKPKGKLSEYDFSAEQDLDYEQSLMLVNQSHRLPQDFVPQMAEYKDSGVQMNVAMLDAYAKLSESVTQKTDDYLYVSSVYRTDEEQGILHAEDPDYALPAGHSEHQTGLAADVYVYEHAGMAFLESEAGKYVNQSCYDFGFIIRYPEGKEEITKIPFEPWHLRYVGLPHSKIIQQKFISFEEYIDLLEPGKFYRYQNYLITRQEISSKINLPQDLKNIVCSPDNTGHLIITGEYN